MADEGSCKRQKLDEVNVNGPPYRWIFPDCRCFYSENLYVKTSQGQTVDAYFLLPRLRTEEAEFRALNEQLASLSDEVQHDIFQQVQRESKRRLQMESLYRQNAAACAARYTPLHPELFPAATLAIPDVVSASLLPQVSDSLSERCPDVAPGLPASTVFTEAFLDTWREVAFGEGRPTGLRHVHEECFEIEVFKKDFTAKLVAEINHFKDAGLPHQWPNTMNRDGCILNEVGLGPFMDRLIKLYLGPVCKAVYGRLLGHGFDAHHSFVVAYSMGTDKTLGVHDDNSEVTINIALSDDYSGASLALYHHARVAHPQQEKLKSYHWRVGAGTMLLHPGEMLHEVLPLESGFRMGLIVWLRSNSFRKKDGCPLCRKTEDLMYENTDAGEVRRLQPLNLPAEAKL